jgi:hypothetical protein
VRMTARTTRMMMRKLRFMPSASTASTYSILHPSWAKKLSNHAAKITVAEPVEFCGDPVPALTPAQIFLTHYIFFEDSYKFSGFLKK